MENGFFRHKNGFTIAGNCLTRDRRLSLKAKGLYLLIMSYVTYEDMKLTKSFLLANCIEGEKSFEASWRELKETGYLKIYKKQGASGRWHYEYELLDEPKEGAYLFTVMLNGEVVNSEESCSIAPPPQKGGSGENGVNSTFCPDPQNHPGGNDPSGKGGSIYNNTNNKTTNNTINQSIKSDKNEKMGKEVIDEKIRYLDLLKEREIEKALLDKILIPVYELFANQKVECYKINQKELEKRELQKVIQEALSFDNIRALYCYFTSRSQTKKIVHYKPYILTCLYNLVVYDNQISSYQRASPDNSFNQFPQNSYDFEQLEKDILSK